MAIRIASRVSDPWSLLVTRKLRHPPCLSHLDEEPDARFHGRRRTPGREDAHLIPEPKQVPRRGLGLAMWNLPPLAAEHHRDRPDHFRMGRSFQPAENVRDALEGIQQTEAGRLAFERPQS